MTPRPDKDTKGAEGVMPGLSMSLNADGVEPGKPYQMIDVSKLPLNLACFDDDPRLPGGRDGHATIAPVDANGNIDLEELRRWSATRDNETADSLTQSILNAVVSSERKPKT